MLKQTLMAFLDAPQSTMPTQTSGDDSNGGAIGLLERPIPERQNAPPTPPEDPVDGDSGGDDSEPAIPRLFTSGFIAETLDQPLHRIKRILATREDIKPIALVGRSRVYASGTLARIRYELNRIDAMRTKRGHWIDD